MACLLLIANVACQSKEEITHEQYLIRGEEIYLKNCANCHGKDGKGLSELYPPLLNADYLNNKSAVLCVIKNGAEKPMTVNGKTYTQAMPKPKLYDLEIAQVSTYLYATFKQSKKTISTEEIAKLVCD
jgi:cytochrome c551